SLSPTEGFQLESASRSRERLFCCGGNLFLPYSMRSGSPILETYVYYRVEYCFPFPGFLSPLPTGVRLMRHALIVLLAVCCFGAFSYSQTADELIAKNIQARGGMEKMKAIKNFRLTGKFDGGGGFTASIGQ